MTTDDRDQSDYPDLEEHHCILCGERFIGYGNNPEPLRPYEDGRCCDDCNAERVIPARMGYLVRDMTPAVLDRIGTWVMVCQWRASDGDTEMEGLYLESFDPDAFEGHGAATWTDDVDKAMRWHTPMDVLRYWQTQSTVKPIRADGRDNRPLTAYTVEPRNLA